MWRLRIMGYFVLGNVVVGVVLVLLAAQVSQGNRFIENVALTVAKASVFPVEFLMGETVWADFPVYFQAVIINGCLWGFVFSLVLETRAKLKWGNRGQDSKRNGTDETGEA